MAKIMVAGALTTSSHAGMISQSGKFILKNTVAAIIMKKYAIEFNVSYFFS